MKDWVIGIDEAGRGPLAGSVYVAILGIKRGEIIKFVKEGEKITKAKLRDSKKLSESQRNRWKEYLLNQKKRNKCFCVVRSASSKIIDTKGISFAVRSCVSRALKRAEEFYNFNFSENKIFLDGSLFAPKRFVYQKTIIKGDENVSIISMASILAKTSRDRRITLLAKEYPKYGFEVHKGYGTKGHMRAIKKHGLCDIHRRSFCKGMY